MDIYELHTQFNLIADKAGSPYFSQGDIDGFLNQAQTAYVNKHLPSSSKSDNLYSYEYNDFEAQLFAPLVEIGKVVAAPAGKIQFSSISLVSPLLKVLGVEASADGVTYYMSKYVRHNDFLAFEQNDFKKGTAKYPLHRYVNDGLQFAPTTTTSARLSVMRFPKPVDYATGQGLEFPAFSHLNILYEAVSVAGITLRDNDLFQATQVENRKTD